MRKLRTWGFGTALALSLGAATVVAGDKDDRPPVSRYGSKTILEELFGSEPRKPTPRSTKGKDRPVDTRNTRAKDKADEAKEDAPPPRSAMAELREREEAKLLRRLEVCDRLRKIARETGDTELEQEAQELDTRAWEIYKEKTANLPGTPTLDVEESRLGKKLPVSSSDAKRLLESGRKETTSKERQSASTVREVNP